MEIFFVRNDPDRLGFAASGRIKGTFPLDESFFLQNVQILADGGKAHMKILHDLKLGGKTISVNIPVNISFIDFL